MLMYPRTAMNDAQHKIEKLLKFVWCMVCLCEGECVCTCVCVLVVVVDNLSSSIFEAGSLLFYPPSELRETLLSPSIT